MKQVQPYLVKERYISFTKVLLKISQLKIHISLWFHLHHNVTVLKNLKRKKGFHLYSSFYVLCCSVSPLQMEYILCFDIFPGNMEERNMNLYWDPPRTPSRRLPPGDARGPNPSAASTSPSTPSCRRCRRRGPRWRRARCQRSWAGGGGGSHLRRRGRPFS